MGLSAVPHSYELNLGMCGMHGRAPSTLMQSRADLIIAVGVRFSDRATGDVSAYASNSKIIHIDIDEAELGKNVPNIIEVCGSAKSVLAALLESTEEKRNEEWRREVLESKEKDAACSDGDRFSPRAIIRCINEYFGGETVVATDVGQHQMWSCRNYASKNENAAHIRGAGTMGFGLGAAIGGSASGKSGQCSSPGRHFGRISTRWPRPFAEKRY